MNIKNIAILGSTGSIGTQTLEVINNHADLFGAFLLTAQSNADLLIAQALQYNPAYVIICDTAKYQYVKESLANTQPLKFCQALQPLATPLPTPILILLLPLWLALRV